MIEVTGLGHRYGMGKASLDGVTFTVPAGSVCAVLGPNGSGKTTLLRILAGVLPPLPGGRPGRTLVLGFDADDSTLDIRRVTGYVPSAGPIPLRQRVRDLVDLHAGVYPELPRDAVLARLAEWRVDSSRSLAELSRGELRRVQLALALLRDPPVLILDEPTDGLDIEATEAVLQGVRDRAGREGRCTLISTHRAEEVERTCDRVVLLRDGRVLLSGDLDDLKEHWARLLVWSPPQSRCESWDGVVSVDRRRDPWEITVARDADAIEARLSEHGATRVEREPLSLRDLYQRAMATEVAP